MKRYTVMIELVDRMSETGVSGPYPVLHTDSLDQAKAEQEWRDKDRYTIVWIRNNLVAPDR